MQWIRLENGEIRVKNVDYAQTSALGMTQVNTNSK